MNIRLLASIAAFVPALMAFAAEMDLAGTWTLRQCDASDKTCRAQVPGGIYAALVEAGMVPHPYYAMNEGAAQWPSSKRWSFSRRFTPSDEILSAKTVTLRLEDVDCFATIKLNGQEIAKTSNRFQRYDVDVTSFLRRGENEIEATFEPTGWMSALEAMKYEKHEYPGAKEKRRQLQLVRTVRCHAGWDWGIVLMDTGLMGTVKLMAEDVARLDYVYTTQRFTSDYSSVDVTVVAELTAPADGRAELSASLCGVDASKPIMLRKGTNVADIRLSIKSPRLWWPRGQGSPILHELVVTCAGTKVVKRVGLRSIELRTPSDGAPDPLSKTGEIGKAFKIAVNGVEVFCQGANWVPCDAMENLQTPERYRDLLSSAASANMNMIRIWGGGQFEHEPFYDICDELGLLVWHDFMFACSIYPVTDYFMDGVKKELAHQLRRLRDHPSIALWCGDNECLHVANHEKDPILLERYLKTCEIREKMLTETVAQYDSTRPFWPASPCKGPGDFRIIDQTSGDYHDWGVWFGLIPIRASFDMAPRFVSEFGFQSHASRDMLERYIPENRIDPNSPDLHAHQKCKGAKQRSGDETIQWFINDSFRYPEGADAYFYISQVLQAMTIRHAIAAWRPTRSRCSGMLIWQLNDNWPVTSWSLVEYGGKWKQAQYHVKRGFAPTGVFAATKLLHKDLLEVRAVNDNAGPLEGTVRVDLHSFTGEVRTMETVPFRLAAHESKTIREFPLSAFGNASERARSFVTLTLNGTCDGQGCHAVDDWVFDKFRDVDLAPAKVTADLAPGPRPGTFCARLSATHPAFYVWANVRNIAGEFDDNSFLLLPGYPRTIVFTAKEPGVTFDRFKKSFSVRHLRDSYR